MIAAREWTQKYVWNSHQPAALKAGLRREIADAMTKAGPPGSGRGRGGRLRHGDRNFATETRQRCDYARAVSKFGEQGVIDLLGVVGYYNFLAIVLNAARTPLREGMPEPLKRYPY